MILVAYWHGLRASEVVGLKRSNLVDGYLDVQRLKGSERTIQKLVSRPDPLLDEGTALLDYALNFDLNQRLFPVTREYFYRLVRKYGELAGLPKHKCRTTSFKHTILTELVDKKGVPIAQKHGGHKSGNSTLQYTKKTQEQSDAAVADL